MGKGSMVYLIAACEVLVMSLISVVQYGISVVL